MPTLKQIQASRRNGRLSRGPITAAGRQRSSQNALRHGLLAERIPLSDESREDLESLLAHHLERFAPADPIEFGLVEQMAAAYWRLRRAWMLESRILNTALECQPNIASCFVETAPLLGLIHRYETRMDRTYQRAMLNLLFIRANYQTNPVPETDTSRDLNPPPTCRNPSQVNEKVHLAGRVG